MVVVIGQCRGHTRLPCLCLLSFIACCSPKCAWPPRAITRANPYPSSEVACVLISSDAGSGSDTVGSFWLADFAQRPMPQPRSDVLGLVGNGSNRRAVP